MLRSATSVLALTLSTTALSLTACGGPSSPAVEPSPQASSPLAPEPVPSPSGPEGDCVRTGCSGTVCAEPGNDMMTTCEYRPEFACYREATCARQSGGACGWTQTDALKACLANPPKE